MLSAVSCSSVQQQSENSVESENVSDEDSINSSELLESKPDHEITITMAYLNGISPELQEEIERFNEADNNYTIITKNYGDYIGEAMADDYMAGYDMADMQLEQDIIKGGVVDIIADNCFSSWGNYEILANKGAFCDFYEFMNGGSEFNKSDLNSHVLELYEIDGQLCRLPLFFNINTMIGPSSYVGNIENWTTDELIEKYKNNAPSGATFNGSNVKDRVYFSVLRNNLGAFVDYENGTANFESAEFVKIIEFCNSFPLADAYYKGDTSAPMFVMERSFFSFEQFHNALWEFESKNGKCTFVGYPSENQSGGFIECMGQSYSICSNSKPEVQRGAWEFLKLLTGEEFQSKMLEFHNEIGFPINNIIFNEEAEKCMNKTDTVVSFNGIESDIGTMTQEEYDRLVEYINSINRVSSYLDHSLEKIVEEELNALFNGKQTAEETAAMIQDRASIMVSEKS